MRAFLSTLLAPLFRVGSDVGPTISSGIGTPEGVIAAPIGSLFLRTDGSTGTTVYRKEAGAGNTGWVATTTGGGGGSSLLVENLQTGTTYAPVIGDADKVITLSSNANPVLTMPLNASVNFPAGQQMATRYTGTGIAKFQVTAPATLNGVAAGSFTLIKGQEAVWWQTATNVWEAWVFSDVSVTPGTKTLGYTNGVLTSVTGPGSATKALSYTDGALTGVVSVSNGVTISKTLTYLNGALTDVTTVVS